MSFKPSGAAYNDVVGRIRPAGLVFDTCGPLYLILMSVSASYTIRKLMFFLKFQFGGEKLEICMSL